MLDDYVRVDLGGTYALTPDAEVFFRAENVLDAEYEEIKDFGTAGRSGYLGLGRGFETPEHPRDAGEVDRIAGRQAKTQPLRRIVNSRIDSPDIRQSCSGDRNSRSAIHDSRPT